MIKLGNHLPRVTSSCGNLECSADCKSALNSLKADLGSCFTSTPGTEALQVFLDQCGIPRDVPVIVDTVQLQVSSLVSVQLVLLLHFILS